jgi:hypothetical protein
MEKKYSLTLNDDMIQYCKLNNIEDPEAFFQKVLNAEFTIIKYGRFPQIVKKIETPIGTEENKIPNKKKQDNKTDIYGDD